MRLAPTVSFNVTISPTATERWMKTRNAVKCTIGKTETEGLQKDGVGKHRCKLIMSLHRKGGSDA